MAAKGERFSMSVDNLRFMGRRGGLVKAAGGWALIKVFKDPNIVEPAWLVGFSVDSDGDFSFASHRVATREPQISCEGSIWCKGVVTSSEGKVISLIGAPAQFPLGQRVDALTRLAMNGEAINPETGQNTALAQLFYDNGHRFDPDRQPVLHEALKQLVVAGS